MYACNQILKYSQMLDIENNFVNTMVKQVLYLADQDLKNLFQTTFN